MSEYIKSLPKPIAIIGMGKSGASAKKLLEVCGTSPSEIFTFDQQKEAQFRDPRLFTQTVQPKTLVVSPGFPLATEWIQTLHRSGAHITSELSLACSCLDSENLIGVTGSVGKSTTVSILGAGLAEFTKSFFVGGNLGIPFADYATDVLLGQRSRAQWVVLELSSYQLENSARLRLALSAITYFTANHMDRYPSLTSYYETKWKIAEKTQGEVILNRHGGDLFDYFQGKDSSKIIWSERDLPALQKYKLHQARLIGQHNQDNLSLAALIALRCKWPESSIQAMKNFAGLPHRLENLGERKGIRFINDSKATALDSVQIAVAAAHETKSASAKLYVLLGGKDKGLPWENLHPLSQLSLTQFVFFGECRELAQKKSGLLGLSYAHLKEALDSCFLQARPGDTVLMSPGGTSLDEFAHFEARGEFFKQQVELFTKT